MEAIGLLANRNLQSALEEIGIKPAEIGYVLAPIRLRQQQRRLSPDQVNDLCAAYVSGSTVRQLAAHYGLHRTTVMAHLERTGIPRRPNTRILTDHQVKEAAQLYEQGDSLDNVAARFGVSQRTIARELRNAGVPIRPSRRDGAPA